VKASGCSMLLRCPAVGMSTGEILEVVEDSTFYPRTHHCG
jgi:hypothetical protein